MAQFGSREEYERWKAKQPVGAGNTTAPTPAAPVDGRLTIARVKPRTGIVVVGVVGIAAASIFLFATGDKFSGFLVLALGGSLVALYWRFKLRPDLDDPSLHKAAALAVLKTAARHGYVSRSDADDVARAKQDALERGEKAKKG